jgi:hypothetical protein
MAFSRHVIFIGGYDPKGGRRVYQEQKRQVERYAKLSGQALSISAPDNSHPLVQTWLLRNETEQTSARFDLLKWDDLVRQRWARADIEVVREGLASLWEFGRTGSILHMWQLSHPLVYAAMLPFGLALLAICLPLLASLLTAGVLHWITSKNLLAWSGGIIVAVMAAAFAYKKLRQAPVTWFLRVVAFARNYGHESNPASSRDTYRERIHSWAQTLKVGLTDSTEDEILIVGYSAGSILATGLLNELSKLLPPEKRNNLAMLTLGNCVPVAACLPAAHALRNDLQSLALQDSLWIDITSPTDWGSIHGIDAASMYAGMPASPQRQQLSPRFHTLFTPESYETLRKDKYRVHQQYLLCTELRGDSPQAYDYFAILAGSLSLRQRYASINTQLK